MSEQTDTHYMHLDRIKWDRYTIAYVGVLQKCLIWIEIIKQVENEDFLQVNSIHLKKSMP